MTNKRKYIGLTSFRSPHQSDVSLFVVSFHYLIHESMNLLNRVGIEIRCLSGELPAGNMNFSTYINFIFIGFTFLYS